MCRHSAEKSTDQGPPNWRLAVSAALHQASTRPFDNFAYYTPRPDTWRRDVCVPRGMMRTFGKGEPTPNRWHSREPFGPMQSTVPSNTPCAPPSPGAALSPTQRARRSSQRSHSSCWWKSTSAGLSPLTTCSNRQTRHVIQALQGNAWRQGLSLGPAVLPIGIDVTCNWPNGFRALKTFTARSRPPKSPQQALVSRP